ncbi:MAG: hypothetical protein M1814_003138 [Vezdaea aestivalis]|nr:MAG: hypothetical protein M1814_003138 [Vezdaea aestivalis]
MSPQKRPGSPSITDEQRVSPNKSLRTQHSSNLTDQLQLQREMESAAANINERSKEDLRRTPTKIRSISDVAPPPLLSSPKFLEASRGAAKDDLSILQVPSTPRRPLLTSRGLSLQMPSGNIDAYPITSPTSRIPLSPKLDSINTYGAAASVLPRRSRGLDFSRACTNLHHSTLADQSSPDSSPTMNGRGMMIPSRKGMSSMSNSIGSPGSNVNSLWSTLGGGERHPIASSLGSVVMMDSDSSTNSDSDDDLMSQVEADDPIVTTPQVYKVSSGLGGFQSHNNSQITGASSGGDWLGHNSSNTASLMSFQRARLRKGRSRKSSSSASLSGGSSLASPVPASPPILKNTEIGTGYFSKDVVRSRAASRRSSLSWGTRELRLSSAGDSDDANAGMVKLSASVTVGGVGDSEAEEKHAVIQRPPKSKNFARIHAALMEEVAPIDTEVRREAQVVQQVRENEVGIEPTRRSIEVNLPDGVPTLTPTHLHGQADQEDVSEDQNMTGQETPSNRRSGSFGPHPSTKAGSKAFWESFKKLETPLPPPLFTRVESSTTTDDVKMDQTTALAGGMGRPPPLQVSTETQPIIPAASEIAQRISNKRRRDDDFDVFSFKRRAVSPSMSVQNSPILQQSPAQKDGSWLSKGSREMGQSNPSSLGGPERGNSGSSNTSVSTGPKRIGLQGMVDTNDAIMKMSIE